MTITWKDTTSYSRGDRGKIEPEEYTARVGEMRLVVHRYIGMPEDMWFGTVYNGASLSKIELKSTKIREAQNELVARVKTWLEDSLKAFE